MDHYRFWYLVRHQILEYTFKADKDVCRYMLSSFVLDDVANTVPFMTIFCQLHPEEREKFAYEYPIAFKIVATGTITEAIMHSADTETIHKLQWEINKVVSKHDNPMGACVAVSRMLSDKLHGENGFFDTLSRYFPPSEEFYEMLDQYFQPITKPERSAPRLSLVYSNKTNQ